MLASGRDQPVGFRKGGGDRLLGVDVQAGLEARLTGRRMRRRRRDVDRGVQLRVAEHRVQVCVRVGGRRPRADALDSTLGGSRTGIAAAADLDPV